MGHTAILLFFNPIVCECVDLCDAFSLLTVYQFFISTISHIPLSSPLSSVRVFLAFLDAACVGVFGDAFAFDDLRVPSLPHVLADLVNRACSALTILGLVGLKFYRFRLVIVGRGFLYFAVFIATRGI